MRLSERRCTRPDKGHCGACREWSIPARLAVALPIVALMMVGYSTHSLSKRLEALENENGRLRSLLHQAERRTKGLRRTAVPLIERAAGGFPEQAPMIKPSKHLDEATRPGNSMPLASIEGFPQLVTRPVLESAAVLGLVSMLPAGTKQAKEIS